jgi:hypothetical protein
VAGKAIELPAKQAAEWNLEQDFSGDGQTDGVVWMRRQDPEPDFAGPFGELWYFPAGSDAKKLWTVPAWFPSGGNCRHQSQLQGLGTGYAWLTLRAECAGSLPQRTPTRAYSLVAPNAARPILFGLRVAEPAPSESLAVSPVVADRDGDGRDDFALRFEMTVADTGAVAAAELGWLDRAAGASFDEAHFLKSLEPTLAAFEGRATKKAKATGLHRESAAIRRLVNSLCEQAATYRVWDEQGDAIRCPQLPKLAVRLTRIEVQAALSLNDMSLALYSLGSSNQWLAPLPTVEYEALRKRIDKQLTQVNAALPVPTSVIPKREDGRIRYSPLKFEADGALTIITDDNRLIRVARDGSNNEIDADSGAAWPLDVIAKDGRKWASVVQACDRSELSLSFVQSSGALSPLFPTAYLANRPGACRNPTRAQVSVSPIDFSEEAPSAVVSGACIDPRGAMICQSPDKLGPVRPGSPRSPDGKRLVFVSAIGPIVYGGAKPEHWTSAALDKRGLSGCVVSNGSDAIACLQDGQLLFVPRTATPSESP